MPPVDNIAVTPGAGATVATDDIGGAQYQRIKIGLGADGTAVDAQAGNGKADTSSMRVALGDIGRGLYETVAASQSATVLGPGSGATGDFLLGVLIIPATTSPGSVQIKDGTSGAITIFVGGASSVSNLVPFMVPLGIYSTGGTGGWQIITGANVSVIGIGNFS